MNESGIATSPAGRLGRLPFLAPLQVRDYRLVWFGESGSLLGDQFHYVALSWLVLGLTGSGLALGTVLLAAALPRGAFLLFGGVLSDRLSPRRLMLVSNVVRAMVTTIIAALVLGAQVQIWQLVLAGIVFGTVDAVFYPAMSTIVARLVPIDALASANALLQGTQQLMTTVGPAVAGVAIAIIGVGPAFAIDAASFAVAATALWLVRRDRAATPPATDSSEPTVARASMLASLVEGARAVAGDPAMFILVVMSTAINVAFTGPIVVGLPWLVHARYEGDASMLGLLLAALSAGAVVGIVLAGTIPRPRSFGGLVLGIAGGLGVGLACIGIAPWQVTAVVLLLVGVGVGYLKVSIITWAQVRTEPHLLGRTMSFLMFGSVVAAPLSLVVAGGLVDANPVLLFMAAGGLVAAVAVVGLLVGLPRRMRW